MAYCAKCGAMLQSGDAYCRACGSPAPPLVPGFVYSTQGPPGAYATPTVYGPLGKPLEQSTAIVALVLNIVIWPGLGSLIAGESVGWAQGFLHLLGVVLTITLFFFYIGIPLMIAMWVWGIITGVQLINRATAQREARLAGTYR